MSTDDKKTALQVLGDFQRTLIARKQTCENIAKEMALSFTVAGDKAAKDECLSLKRQVDTLEQVIQEFDRVVNDNRLLFETKEQSK